MTLAEAPNYQDYFVIRNVGQGLWITHVMNSTCEHYDFGGELFQIKKLKKQLISQCYNKLNKLNLSHADMDHYSFLNLIYNKTQASCWSVRPQEILKNEPQGLTYCMDKDSASHILFYESYGSNKNDRSIVQQVHHFLIPGDSSIKMEKIWSQRLKYLNHPIKYLVLGHHGSRTATGENLLAQLPHLKMAFASARFLKYKHPHSETLKRLRKHHVPLIKTEDWGDIRMNY